MSKSKLQLWSSEVKYLGHCLTKEGRKIEKGRKTAILQAPKLANKKQMMSFLGLANYCRSWVIGYAQLTQPLNDHIYGEPMTASEKIKWTDSAEDAFCKLKQTLAGSGTLALPNYTKPFFQTVDCREGFMTSI